MPPSTFRLSSLRWQSASMAFSTSKAWKHAASKAAFTRCFRSCRNVSPHTVPRASSLQCGANRPPNAGTNTQPALPSAPHSAANASASDALPSTLSWSLSHCSREPATATAPSRAYTGGCPCSWYATVVRSPWVEGTGSVPVFIIKKQPVPYVHFASPALKHACPKRAACWSPKIPATGTPGKPVPGAQTQYTSELVLTAGSMALGMRKAVSSSSSQESVWRLNKSVRDALLTSVTCTGLGLTSVTCLLLTSPPALLPPHAVSSRTLPSSSSPPPWI
mmetsp:Transcript_47751/g.88946  ORF Transcript_47751/g.88946 Transcript_47751/m.88946 type:complete len:277 (+) Transcript_47751:629-1459(+)